MKRFAKPYAQVLLDAARETKSEDQLAAELGAFVALVGGTPDLERIVRNPALPPAEKQKVVDGLVAKAAWSPLTAQALRLLTRKERLDRVDDILEAYQELLDQARGIVLAEVRAAHALDPSQQQALEQAIARAAGKKVRAQVSIEPELLAGVVAKVGSTVYDASLRGQIQKMRRLLGG